MTNEDFAKLVGYLVQDIVANEKDFANFGAEKKPTRYFVEEYLPKFNALFEKKAPVCEDMEEEYNKFVLSRGLEKYAGIVILTARHFAQWQLVQMMKDAVSAEVIGAGSKESCILRAVGFSDGFKYGDKVKIIIIKE